jgi:hypothetical protein
MHAQDDHTSSADHVISEAGGFLAALGALTMALFPLAIPGIALVAVAVVPLVLLALVVAVLAAVVAAPVMAVAALRRYARGRRGGAGFGAASAQPS